MWAVNNAVDQAKDIAKSATGVTTDIAGDAARAIEDVASGAPSLVGVAFGKINEATKIALDEITFAVS